VVFTLEWPCLVPRLLAEAAASLGEVDAALTWAGRAEQVAAAAGAQVELARLAVLRAGLLLTRNDDASVRTAVELIDEATRAFDAMGMLRFARQAQRLFDLPPPVDAAARSLRPRAILFTDIVDSTAWNARLGDDHWLVLLADHNRRARASVRRDHGVVVKTTGDGVCAWFGAVTEAVDCAQALQRGFEEFRDTHPETPIRIRCGVALGDVYDFDGDLAGLAVTEAARVCAVAGGDQIVVSAAVAHGDEDGEHVYTSLGDHDLKGLPGLSALFAVGPP
jgi:class 3 adenylate cyclase